MYSCVHNKSTTAFVKAVLTEVVPFCKSGHIYIYIYIYIYICMYVCMYVFMYIYNNYASTH